MDFWDRLKTEVKNQNTTQAWVAEKAGIPFGTFQRWLSHKTMPNADQALALAQTLGTSVEFLLTGKAVTDPWIAEYQDLIRELKSLPSDKLNTIRLIARSMAEEGKSSVRESLG